MEEARPEAQPGVEAMAEDDDRKTKALRVVPVEERLHQGAPRYAQRIPSPREEPQLTVRRSWWRSLRRMLMRITFARYLVPMVLYKI